MFIAFEGIDGSGKTTQIQLLHRYLQRENIDSVVTSEPTDGIIGKLIKKMLREKEFDAMAMQLLFVADRSYHVDHYIKKWDSEGRMILCDRYLFSTLAFGAASGIDRDWLLDINRMFPMPDITVVLDVPPRLAIKRIHSRMSEYIKHAKFVNAQSSKAKTTLYEKLGFLAKVRLEYLKMSKEFDNYFVVNGTGNEGAISKKIISIINENI